MTQEELDNWNKIHSGASKWDSMERWEQLNEVASQHVKFSEYDEQKTYLQITRAMENI